MYQFFLPESMYKVDSEMYFQKLLWYYESNSALTGKVTRIHEKQKYLDVDLGGGIMAKMSFNESTIYPIYKPNSFLSPNVYTLVDKNIQVKIIKLQNFSNIWVSRKESMQEVLINIKDQKAFDFVEITAYSNLSAFIDVGGGIRGKIAPINFSPVKFNHIGDIEIPVGTIIPVSVLNFDMNTIQFELSRIFPNTESSLYAGQILTAKIFEPLGDNVGYFCLVKTSICAIIDSPYEELHYGDNVVARVKRISSKGAKLEFLRKFTF